MRAHQRPSTVTRRSVRSISSAFSAEASGTAAVLTPSGISSPTPPTSLSAIAAGPSASPARSNSVVRNILDRCGIVLKPRTVGNRVAQGEDLDSGSRTGPGEEGERASRQRRNSERRSVPHSAFPCRSAPSRNHDGVDSRGTLLESKKAVKFETSRGLTALARLASLPRAIRWAPLGRQAKRRLKRARSASTGSGGPSRAVRAGRRAAAGRAG